MQGASPSANPSQSLDSIAGVSAYPMQAGPDHHKNFGQPVVSKEQLLTPAQASARFHVPEYLLRKACAEGRLEHYRVVNALWLAPSAVAAFAESWRAR
jgi:hypothetical protein